MSQRDETTEREAVDRPLRIEDAVRYLVVRWRRLVLVFAVVAISLAAVVWATRAQQVWPVRGTITLTFKGIETHRYPTGRPFDEGELISPTVIAEARRAAGLTASVAELADSVSVSAVIPPAVVARWQQQDRQGQEREAYYPADYRITIGGGRLSRDEKFSLFRGIVEAYQSHLRSELYVTEFHISDAIGFGDGWKRLDPFELPQPMHQALPIMRRAATTLLELAEPSAQTLEQLQAEEPRELSEAAAAVPLGVEDLSYSVLLAELHAQIGQFESGPLASLEGLTYSRGITNDREQVLRTGEQLLLVLNQRLDQARQETAILKETIESVDRPQFMVPSFDGVNRPVEMNKDMIGTLLRNDYYAELIRRSIATGERVSQLQAERDALARRLQSLRGAAVPPTPEWETAARRAVDGFKALRDRYRELVVGYFDLVAASHVRIKNGPYVDYSGRTPASVVALALIAIALLMALFVVRLHEMVAKAQRAS